MQGLISRPLTYSKPLSRAGSISSKPEQSGKEEAVSAQVSSEDLLLHHPATPQTEQTTNRPEQAKGFFNKASEMLAYIGGIETISLVFQALKAFIGFIKDLFD